MTPGIATALYREMIRAYTASKNDKALELAKRLKDAGRALTPSRLADVRHVLRVLGGEK